MKKILLSLSVIIAVFVGYKLIIPKSDNSSITSSSQKDSVFDFSEDEYDFGLIKQSGGKVSHDFPFTYKGETSIEITGVPTSCACTSATVDQTNLRPGDTGILTVKFNPNLHEEPEGKFFKTATLITDPKLADMPEVRIWVEIDLDLGQQAYELKSDHYEEEEEGEDGLTSYTSVTPEKLVEMLDNKDFTLVDVHIPEQGHIENTDQFIPYTEIEDNLDMLPQNKDAKIVVYCRSGGMSRAAAYTLVEHGYTNVYDLVGGKNSFDDYIEEQGQAELKAQVEAGGISFEATVITEQNMVELNDRLDRQLSNLTFTSEETVVLLEMSNHRNDLSKFDYQALASLDGMSAQGWEMLSSAIGGHHVDGILVFPASKRPKSLTITESPGGDIVLKFKSVT